MLAVLHYLHQAVLVAVLLLTAAVLSDYPVSQDS